VAQARQRARLAEVIAPGPFNLGHQLAPRAEPADGAGVVALLLVLPLTLSGYATYNDLGDFLGGDWLEDLHGFFGEAMLAVVLAHVALIAALSLLRRKNQAQPMLSGRVEGAGPDLAKKNHAWLAAVLLLSVFAFGAWQWQQSPNGLIPSTAWSGGGSGHGQDGDDDDN
jgi:hypothetical protein